MTQYYKHWEVVESMPKGFKEDKKTGSPLFGHIFITNGKSVLNGQVRKLLKIQKKN